MGGVMRPSSACGAEAKTRSYPRARNRPVSGTQRSGVLARSQRAHRCAARPTSARAVEEAVRGMGDEAHGIRL